MHAVSYSKGEINARSQQTGGSMYIPESIQAKEDYQACVNFHGHTCMGVTIGYQAAKLAMKLLGEMRACRRRTHRDCRNGRLLLRCHPGFDRLYLW